MTAREYGQQVRVLVRKACPEFLSKDGSIKNTSMPAYNAALFRHFLVGLSAEEATLISRLKATTFETAIEELVREELLPGATGPPPEDSWPLKSSSHVRWASPIRTNESARQSGEGDGGRYPSAPRRSGPDGRTWPRAPRSASPGGREGAGPAGGRAVTSAEPAKRRSQAPEKTASLLVMRR